MDSLGWLHAYISLLPLRGGTTEAPLPGEPLRATQNSAVQPLRHRRYIWAWLDTGKSASMKTTGVKKNKKLRTPRIL